MCEANAYVWEQGEETLLLERVDTVVPGVDTVYLENIFGQRTTFAGRIKELHLVDHRIVLERLMNGE